MTAVATVWETMPAVERQPYIDIAKRELAQLHSDSDNDVENALRPTGATVADPDVGPWGIGKGPHPLSPEMMAGSYSDIAGHVEKLEMS